jgi:hypothetical protein
MNALLKPTLTDSERARIRGELFKEKRKDSVFMQEVIGESNVWHSAYVKSDFIAMGNAIDAELWNYLSRNGMFEDAERELLASKDVNGKGWLTS